MVKNLDALENSGQINELVTAKTATLTTGEMKVARLEAMDNIFKISNGIDLQTSDFIFDLMSEAIVFSNTANFQKIKGEQKIHGNPIDVALMNFLESQSVDIRQKLIDREFKQVSKLQIPFNTERKITTCAY